ncbi:hypothetical protein C8Q77DRAFT_440292 [Trametes polyzona]|nr:hypothetical protein C8Q77DRAFT_440292 [Trametes polyzona]
MYTRRGCRTGARGRGRGRGWRDSDEGAATVAERVCVLILAGRVRATVTCDSAASSVLFRTQAAPTAARQSDSSRIHSLRPQPATVNAIHRSRSALQSPGARYLPLRREPEDHGHHTPYNAPPGGLCVLEECQGPSVSAVLTVVLGDWAPSRCASRTRCRRLPSATYQVESQTRLARVRGRRRCIGSVLVRARSLKAQAVVGVRHRPGRRVGIVQTLLYGTEDRVIHSRLHSQRKQTDAPTPRGSASGK